MEGSDSSLHCWGWVLWGWPLGTATVRATVTRYPGKGSSYACGCHTGASAGLGLGSCLLHEEDDWKSANQRGWGEERREAWSWRVGAMGQDGQVVVTKSGSKPGLQGS